MRAIARRVLYLHLHNAPPSTPLAHVYNEQNSIVPIKPKHITDAIRLTVRFLGPAVGFLSSNVTARCLQVAGANALLCGGVDTDVIRLLRR